MLLVSQSHVNWSKEGKRSYTCQNETGMRQQHLLGFGFCKGKTNYRHRHISNYVHAVLCAYIMCVHPEKRFQCFAHLSKVTLLQMNSKLLVDYALFFLKNVIYGTERYGK